MPSTKNKSYIRGISAREVQKYGYKAENSCTYTCLTVAGDTVKRYSEVTPENNLVQ